MYGICRTVDGKLEKHVILEGIQLDVVAWFCYIGDDICPGGGSELATIAQTSSAMEKFRKLLLLLLLLFNKVWKII